MLKTLSLDLLSDLIYKEATVFANSNIIGSIGSGANSRAKAKNLSKVKSIQNCLSLKSQILQNSKLIEVSRWTLLHSN